ncbi:MAG: hypothetical protein M1814_001880 [Vezdaea aestivalis]|nr:MAG: hypothetical protein M1814_001880 [Vezdaea aestivalis]
MPKASLLDGQLRFEVLYNSANRRRVSADTPQPGLKETGEVVSDSDCTQPSKKRKRKSEPSRRKLPLRLSSPPDGKDCEEILGSTLPCLDRPATPKSGDVDVGHEDHDATNHQELIHRQTELESAFAPVKVDKDAIAKYEALRSDDTVEGLDIHERSAQRKWVPGKSSIYVDGFNLALDTVLSLEANLFDEKEHAVFDEWKRLDYEAQHLYVRLFLRKTSAWHRIDRLRYHNDIADLPKAIASLKLPRSLPLSTADSYFVVSGGQDPSNTRLAESFTFADDSKEGITSLEDASSLLSLDELKVITKEAKAQGKNKAELLSALQRVSRKQAGLEVYGLKRTVSGDTVDSNASSGDNRSPSPVKGSRDSHYLCKILETVGDCVRLSSETRTLFERVHLVFHRSTEWNEKSLTTIVLALMSRQVFPDYVVQRTSTIFESRSLLLEFEAALRCQDRVELAVESNPDKEGIQEVLRITEDAYDRLKVLRAEEQEGDGKLHDEEELPYLMRFSPAWIYVRILHKSTALYAKSKKHLREHEILTELLDQKWFHPARRGAWYQRKALIEEHYMHLLSPDSGREAHTQRQHWKAIALRTCELGLQDPQCHLIYHYDLQNRITKLEKALRLAKRKQHDFSHQQLTKPVETTITGRQIIAETLPLLHPHRRASLPQISRVSTRTSWVDPSSSEPCTVEELSLTHYRDRGYKGFHAEGGILRTLFAHLFYSVLYLPVPNVFQNRFQTCPLDLFSDAFYAARQSEINHLLKVLGDGDGPAVLARARREMEEKGQPCVVGLDWSFEFDDLKEIVECFPPSGLAALCMVFAQDYRMRGGGVPDLLVWCVEKKEVIFVEVKSVNDRLSDTQRLWCHVLAAAGVRVELCHVLDEGQQ